MDDVLSPRAKYYRDLYLGKYKSTNGAMTEEKDQSRELLSYIRERDEAREELKKVKEELSATKSKLYDANCDIEDLEHDLKKAEERRRMKTSKVDNQKKLAAASGKTTASSSSGGGKGAPAKKGGKANTLKAPTKASPATSSTNVKDESKKSPVPPPATSSSKGHRHPPIEGKLHLSEDTIAYYTEVAEQFPNLKLQQVLDAEKKFNLADENGDGVIDRDELNKVLTQHSDIALFTPSQVQSIMTEIDKDDTGTLDFFEVLAILEKLTRRKANKPELQTIQQHQAKVCAIQ